MNKHLLFKRSNRYMNNKAVTYAILNFILLLSGDIELNPGPETIYPCGYCEHPVTWEHQRAVCCDNCDLWYHSDCLEYSTNKFELIQHSNVSWICCKCNTQNLDSFTFHSFEFEISNPFSILSSSIASSIPSIDSSFSPTIFSSPKHFTTRIDTRLSSPSSVQSSYLQPKQKNIRTLVVNCQSIRNKRAGLQAATHYVKPDIIIGNQSCLASEHTNSEIFPDGYKSMVYRKDRNKNGGGVFIAVQDGLTTSEIDQGNTKCEIVWTEIQTEKEKSLIIGSFYRTPNMNIDILQELRNSLENLPKNSDDKTIILAGDFNLPHIDWQTNSVKTGGNQIQLHQELLNIMNEFGLEQMQMKPTREGNILDLYLTNNPSLVKSCETIPGLSDHDMLVVDSDLKPNYSKPKRRKIFIYKRADMEKIKQEMSELSSKITSIAYESINKMWEKFKKGIFEIMEKNIPSKLTSSRQNLPWINNKLRRIIKKKHKLYIKARNSGKKEDWDRYRLHKRFTQKTLRQAHWDHVNNILEDSLQKGNRKPFWKYIKAKKKDNIGVAPIKDNGRLHSDSQSKAELLNKQFQSVFTKEKANEPVPEMTGTAYPSIKTIEIKTEGVEKLLLNLDCNKASGRTSK